MPCSEISGQQNFTFDVTQGVTTRAVVGHEICFGANDNNVPTTVQVKFTPSGNQQMKGSPREFFNTPQPGGDLIATLPVQAQRGDPDFSVTLNIEEQTGGGHWVAVPVTVRRP